MADRSKDDAYGLNHTNKKCLSSNKSDKIKLKNRRIVNGSSSSRKSKLTSKNVNYQPACGTINLIGKNDKSPELVESGLKVSSINSRKGSHKRTNSIETSERSDQKSKNRFLVSKKYNPQMSAQKAMSTKDNVKSCLSNSIKIGTSTSISK